MLQGRTENAIKNYFYSTVRKNIRRVNKKLILREKIKGSVKELMQKQEFSDLIFCNSSQSLKMAVKLSRELRFNGERENSVSTVVKEEESVTNDIIEPEPYLDQNANAWREYYQYYTAAVYWASQVQPSYY